MLKRIAFALLIATTASAQTSADLEKRVDEMKRQIDLDLVDCRILKGGHLAVTYRVKH